MKNELLKTLPTELTSPVIRCLPMGVCSWNYRIDGLGRKVEIRFDWLSETGAILIKGNELRIKKHGMRSGKWTLEMDGNLLAAAKKRDVFTRTVDIADESGSYVLQAVSALGRTFNLTLDEQIYAVLKPDHAMTRRASIEVRSSDVEFTTLVFAFWLVALMWKRAANSG